LSKWSEFVGAILKMDRGLEHVGKLIEINLTPVTVSQFRQFYLMETIPITNSPLYFVVPL
jgi:hypothetical protein